jgi:hypothetical protein
MLSVLGQAHAVAAQASAESIGYATTLEGSVTLIRAKETQSLRTGQEVYSGDIVVTGLDGAVTLTMVDGSIFCLGGKTRLRLVHFQIRPAQGREVRESAATVDRGTVVVRAGGAALAVTTPTTTVRAQNTHFGLEVK